MKTSAYVKELQAQSVEQLQAQLVDAKKELFNLRFQNATNQLDNTARIKEGFTLEDFKRVIDWKVSKWIGTDMEQYLRPETLFGTKFESYLNEAPATRAAEIGRAHV